MPKKRNFLGGMQNYNPKTGEYESRLTKADGTPATKENMPGGEDNKKSFKSFKKNTEVPRPVWAEKINDEMKPVFEQARKKDAEMENRFKKLAEKSGIDYNEIKNEYINILDKITKEKRFGEEESFDVALDLLEEDINSKITNDGSKDTTFDDINAKRMGIEKK